MGNAGIDTLKVEADIERMLLLKYPELFPDGAEVHINLIDRNHV